jgi:hypothetical protein
MCEYPKSPAAACPYIVFIFCAPSEFGRVAESRLHSLAEMTLSAGNLERDDHAIALFQTVVFAHFFDDAHELVSQDVAFLHGWDVTVEDVKVGAADCRRRDP